MSGWGTRLRHWLGGAVPTSEPGGGPGAGGGGAPAAGADAPAAMPDAVLAQTPDPAETERRFFGWLTGVGVLSEAPFAPSEQQLLVHLDMVIFSEESRAVLLPRARSIVPQLLARLRDESQSAQALAVNVARDPNLVVEVIRMANSVGYRGHTPVADPVQAIGRLGTEGLRRAIARVLLKPIFDAQADPLLGRAADRLWQHSEVKAGLCLQQALVARLDPFEAYLAGLMHNVGWTAALRALDRSAQATPVTVSSTFVQAFVPRRDRLFAAFVRSWELSASLTALAEEVLAAGFLHCRSPLALLLGQADRVATQQALSGSGYAPPGDGAAPS